jgi:hypothetical protein
MDALSRLGYPEVWRTMRLYPDDLRAAQEADLAREPPGDVGGTEHYRYGAFCFWLRNPDTPQHILGALISAAAADPDSAMAQAALIDLVAHRNCDDSLYHRAFEAFSAFPEQHFEGATFERAHRERLPSWKLHD